MDTITYNDLSSPVHLKYAFLSKIFFSWVKLITFEVCATGFGGRQVVIFVILAYHGLRAAPRAIKSLKVLDRWIDDSKRISQGTIDETNALSSPWCHL